MAENDTQRASYHTGPDGQARNESCSFRYQITLYSPMGPRNGELILTDNQGAITGTLSILGYQNPVCGESAGETQIHLSGQIHSAVSSVSYDLNLPIAKGCLSGIANTTGGPMKWTGTLIEDTEQLGKDRNTHE